MDQHEKDWQALGQQLKHYQPAGDPDQDFADFLAFQQVEEQGASRRSFLWWLAAGLLVLGLFLTSGYFLIPSYGPPATAEASGMAVPTTEQPATTTFAPATEQPQPTNLARTQVPGKVETNQGQPTNSGQRTGQKPVAKPIGRGQGLTGRGLADRSHSATASAIPASLVNHPAAVNQPDQLTSPLPADPVPALVARKESKATVVASLPGLDAFVLLPESPLSAGRPAVVPPGRIAMTTATHVTMGLGVSNHWRGDRFLEQIDRGVYAYLGVTQDFGRKFGVEAQIGYRGHGMDFPIVKDTKEYWSHRKEESEWTDDQGNVHSYEYEGIVEGYRAIEFSLLLHYRPVPRLSLQAGGRYALPAMKFSRVVGGSDVRNPYHQFVVEEPLVRNYDFGLVAGAAFRVTPQLSVETGVNFGQVDLIRNTADGTDRFNHSSSLNVGLKYYLK